MGTPIVYYLVLISPIRVVLLTVKDQNLRDLTNEKYLWWPDGSIARYMMCISKYPGVGDLNSTTYTDYMVK